MQLQCACLLHCPLMLPCLHHQCSECLCLHIQQSGQIICADCQATVQVPPPLSLSLLADQPAQCPSCKEEVQLKNINKHMSSSCTLHTHKTACQTPIDRLRCVLQDSRALLAVLSITTRGKVCSKTEEDGRRMSASRYCTVYPELY